MIKQFDSYEYDAHGRVKKMTRMIIIVYVNAIKNPEDHSGLKFFILSYSLMSASAFSSSEQAPVWRPVLKWLQSLRPRGH